MAAISPGHYEILKAVLDRDYVPSLPELMSPSNDEERNKTKNRSRAFAGFVLQAICGTTIEAAVGAVVDDFDDEGLDCIHYNPANKTLYIVQGKLKRGELFGQDEAQSFCTGIRKLILHDLDDFNEHVIRRRAEIEAALDDCDHIQLVVAYIGDGLSEHAKRRLRELLEDGTLGDPRLEDRWIEFDSQNSVGALRDLNAVPPISPVLNLAGWSGVDVPKKMFYGTMRLSVLVDLHKEHGNGLFHKNIRSFLGTDTDVNSSILTTLRTDCTKFFYLNNGVTILCTEIDQKGNPGQVARLQTNGLSVINGAQTIATASKYLLDVPEADISEAKLLVTIVEIPEGDSFGAEVTRARNHQNAVLVSDFAGLDAEQERLRTEIANLGINYTYKGVGSNRTPSPTEFYIGEASQALAVTLKDPKYTASFKGNPVDFLDMQRPNYTRVFNSNITAYQLVNSVKCDRYVQERTEAEASSAADQGDRLIYRNGNYLLSWLLSRHYVTSINAVQILDEGKVRANLGQPYDALRQVFIEETKKLLGTSSHSAFFKNQSQVTNLAKLIMIRHFGIVVDEEMRRREQANPDNYIEHLASLAPQINLHE